MSLDLFASKNGYASSPPTIENMSKVSGKAAAAREKARQKDGKFGVQPKLEAGIKLEDLTDKDLDSYTRDMKRWADGQMALKEILESELTRPVYKDMPRDELVAALKEEIETTARFDGFLNANPDMEKVSNREEMVQLARAYEQAGTDAAQSIYLYQSASDPLRKQLAESQAEVARLNEHIARYEKEGPRRERIGRSQHPRFGGGSGYGGRRRGMGARSAFWSAYGVVKMTFWIQRLVGRMFRR